MGADHGKLNCHALGWPGQQGWAGTCGLCYCANVFTHYSVGDGQTWIFSEGGMLRTTFNFEVEPFVWNKGFKGGPGGTEAKQEAGAVAQVRRKLLMMGNNGKNSGVKRVVESGRRVLEIGLISRTGEKEVV